MIPVHFILYYLFCDIGIGSRTLQHQASAFPPSFVTTSSCIPAFSLILLIPPPQKDFTVQAWLALNFRYSCLSLMSTGITGCAILFSFCDRVLLNCPGCLGIWDSSASVSEQLELQASIPVSGSVVHSVCCFICTGRTQRYM